MSHIVISTTPFINKKLLCDALKSIGCGYIVQGDEILTDRRDNLGVQKFVLQKGRYGFWHDSDNFLGFGWFGLDNKEKSNFTFLKEVESAYKNEEKKKMEEEERIKKELEQLAKEKAKEAERKKLEEEQKRLEEERLCLERERQEFIEKQRQAIVEKAKKMGYSVKETKSNNKIKLVLVRTAY